jgi:hypothetical protein
MKLITYVKSFQISQISQISQIIISVLSPNDDTRLMLGRWHIRKTEQEIAKVIQMANEDHCGTCSDSPKESVSTEMKHS